MKSCRSQRNSFMSLEIAFENRKLVQMGVILNLRPEQYVFLIVWKRELLCSDTDL